MWTFAEYPESDPCEKIQMPASAVSYIVLLYTSISSMDGSVAPGEPEEKPAVGYVEPVPDFYARLLALTKMTKQGLSEMEVLNPYSEEKLTNLEGILSKLQEISEKELENKELTTEEYEFIKNFGDQLEGTNGADDDVKKTTVVADVHTDGNSGDVLEEGVGYVDMNFVRLTSQKIPPTWMEIPVRFSSILKAEESARMN